MSFTSYNIKQLISHVSQRFVVLSLTLSFFFFSSITIHLNTPSKYYSVKIKLSNKKAVKKSVGMLIENSECIEHAE